MAKPFQFRSIEEAEAQLSQAELEKAQKEAADRVSKAMAGEIKWKEAFGVPSHVLEALYAEAYRLYNAGLYPRAEKLFLFLTNCDPEDPRFCFALAATQQRLGHYLEALFHYLHVADRLLPTAPRPLFHLYDCQLQLGNKEAAKSCLEEVLRRDDASGGQYPQMRRKAEALLEGFKQGEPLIQEEGPPLEVPTHPSANPSEARP